MFQFSDDIDEDLLEDVLSMSTNKIVKVGETNNTSNVCSASKDETAPAKNSSNIALDDFDEDDLILSAFEDANNSFPVSEKSVCDSPVLKCNRISPPGKPSCQNTHSVRNSDHAFSPVAAKHKSPNSFDSPNAEKYSKLEYERRFPGPAGLMLKKSKEKSSIPREIQVPSKNPQIEAHKIDDSCDSNPSWQALLDDVNSNENKLLQRVHEFTINNVKRLNLVKETSWKIPIFGVIISNIDSSIYAPCVTLKDPTGEIIGTLDKDLWDQYNHLLSVGSALLLRKVSVMSWNSSRKLYLNITTNNIVTIYTFPTDDKPLATTHMKTVSENDFLNETMTDSPASSSFSSSCSNAKTRSNTDLLNLIKNSNTLETSHASSTPKKPSFKNHVTELRSNSVTTSSSGVNSVKSSPNIQSCESKASLIFNELEGLDADSLFDDF